LLHLHQIWQSCAHSWDKWMSSYFLPIQVPTCTYIYKVCFRHTLWYNMSFWRY
jgi:hypothetical protein